MNNRTFTGLLDGVGEWKVLKEPGDPWWSIQVSVQGESFIPELQSNGLAIELMIARSRWLGNGQEIKNIFVWMDPDLDTRYEFRKDN